MPTKLKKKDCLTLGASMSCCEHMLKSVYDAAIERNRYDVLERWDYSRSDDPKNVAFKSHKVVYFKCPRGIHESTGFKPSHIFHEWNRVPKNQQCPKCNSFAQWGIDTLGDDFLDKYWDYDKNTIDPWVLQKRSNQKVWLKCGESDYHPSYDVSCSTFTSGSRCPYCRGFRTVPKDSLGGLHPEAVELWSDKNSISAFEVHPSSNKKVWWKCEQGKHEDYCRSAKDSKRYKFRCPECAKDRSVSSYQKMAAEELGKYGYTLLHEEDCTLNPINSVTGRKMRYDNELLEIRLICEVHGGQHYKQDNYFASSLSKEERELRFQESKRRDREKKEYAISHGYTYLELPYTSFKDESYIRRIQYAVALAKKAASA